MFSMPWKCYLTVGIIALLAGCGTPASQGGESATSSLPAATPNTTATGSSPAGDSSSTPPAATPASATTPGTPSQAPVQGGSGIRGRTVIGPICPVQRADQPCPPKPYAAKINVIGSGNQPVTQAQADAQGQFRIDLPAGTYTLVPLSPGLYPRAAQQTVTVSSSGYISVTINYDSGIR